jgi:hypothetical protein
VLCSFLTLCLDRPGRLLPVDFATKSLKALLISAVHTISLANPTISDLIGLSVFVEDKKL